MNDIDISDVDDNSLVIRFMDLCVYQQRGIGNKDHVSTQLKIAYEEILRRMAKE